MPTVKRISLPCRLPRYSLRSFLLFWLLAALLIGFYREPLARRLGLDRDESPFVVIASEADMQAALSSKHAVIYAYVDWSPESVMAEDQFNSFARDWRRRFHGPRVNFYLLDLSRGPNAPKFATDWLATDKRLPTLMGSGMGEVVWLKSGALIDCHMACYKTVDELTERTEALFTGN